jgi:hypothetical protein
MDLIFMLFLQVRSEHFEKRQSRAAKLSELLALQLILLPSPFHIHRWC